MSASEPLALPRSVSLGARSGELGLRWIAVGSSHLVLTAWMLSVLGYIYWIGAAHLFSATTVGRASALISAMLLIAELANVGVGFGLAYLLPTAGQRRPVLIASALWMVAAAAVSLSLLAVAVSRLARLEISSIVGSGASVAVFILACTAWVLSLVVDQILKVEAATVLVMLRNAVGSLVRFAVLGAVALVWRGDPTIALFGGWGVGAGLSMLLVVLVFRHRRAASTPATVHFDTGALKQLLPVSWPNYLLAATEAATFLTLPIIVSEVLSPEWNAYFYTTWMISLVLYTIPVSISDILFARTAAAGQLSRRAFTRVLAIALAVLVPLAIALIGTRGLVLSFFGSQFVAHSSDLLILLVVAAIPWSVCRLYIGLQRVRRDFRRALLVNSAVLIGVLLLTTLLIGRGGVLMVGWAVCISPTAVAAVCLIDLYRPTRASVRAAEAIP